MNKKMPKHLLVAAVLTTLTVSTAVNMPAKADDWTPGMRITGDMTIDSGSNFSNYEGVYQGVLVNWGTGTVTVSGTDDAVFENNTAVGDAGGALYNANGATTIIDTASQFIENTANRAGAVWNNGTLTFNNKATFTGNNMTGTVLDAAANAAGGAIFNSSYNQDPTAGTLTFNKGVEFSNNSALQGGAIRDGGTTTVLRGAKFENNKATAGDGGSILLASDANIESANPSGTYDNLTVTGSTAAGNGGGAAINKGASLKVTENAIFQSNSAGNNGGGISNAGSVTLTNAQFGSSVIKNEVGIVTGIESQQMGNSSVNHGGAISNIGASARLQIGENSIFAGNSTTGASGQGGALANMEGAVSNIGNGTIFAYNHSATAGGAISSTVNDAKITTTNTIIGNDVQFVGNSSGAQGGAIHNQRTSMTIGYNAKFYNNSSGSYAGGAIYQETSENMPKATLTIGDNAEFVNNESKTSFGGAIFDFNAGGGTELTVGSEALFKGNKAASNGGAIASYGGVFKVDDGATFTGNESGGLGGAVFNDSYGQESTSKLTINGNTTFENNSAQKGGGAIYNAGLAELNTTAGDIKFTGNTAAGNANDIFAAENSTTNITGKNSVSIGSGLFSEEASSINVNGTSNLVIEENVTADISGSISTTADAVITNNGTINLNSTSSSTGNINNTETGVLNIAIDNSAASVQNMADITNDGNVNITGNVSGGSITNNGDITVEGTYITDVIQNSSEASILVDGGIFGTGETLEAGSLTIVNGGKVNGIVNVTEAVEVSVGDAIFDSKGLLVGGDPNNGHITGAFNLKDTNVKFTDALTEDLTISGSSSIATDDTIVKIGDGNSHNTLTLSNDSISSAGGKGFEVTSPATIKLSPDAGKSMTLNENVTGNGTVLVDEKVTKIDNPEYDKDAAAADPDYDIPEKIDKPWGVGTVNIAGSDHSKFEGNFLQKMGTVIAQAGSKFFGGTNSIEGGTLVLQDGSDLTTNVTSQASTEPGSNSYGTIDIYNQITGTIGEDGINRISADSIANGNNAVLEYINSDETTNNVNINSAGLGLFNGTRVEGDLTLNSDSGVRDLTFGNDSGSESDNITLNASTKLTYADNAYIKDDSAVTMNNATLEFANNSTDVAYKPVVDGSGTIAMTGAGTTSVNSELNKNINISATNGVLNLDNKSTTEIGNVTSNNGAINLKADNISVKDVNVSGQNGAANFSGNVTSGGNASVSDNGTLGLFGNANFDRLSANNGSLNLTNGAVNTVNVDSMIVNGDSSIFFDADPRSQLTDTIIVGDGTGSITAGTGTADDPYKQVIVGGINFTQSPIDRNVQFDISNLIQGNSTNPNLIRLPDGGIVTNTAMGQYLLTSSGAGTPMVTANLTYLNPQMYRGQVATIASWQNQLLVNNLLFDHMNLVTRKLMDEERTANKYAAAVPQIDPYQYSIQDGSLWYKAYGAFETLSMTKGLNVGNNAYGSLIGADFPLINLKNGWKLVPTAYIGYNGAHQHFNGVSMYQNGAQLGIMGTAYKGDFMTSLLAYGGGYANDMTVRGQYGGGSDTTGNWFAGVASKSAYNIRLPHDFIIQPAFMAAYNAFGQQNWGSNFGNMSMSSGMLNGLNIAPGLNFIWQKKTFSIYATTQLVYNVMGGVDGKAGNIDMGYVRMRHCYFEYGLGVMKKFKDTFSGYLQFVIRNGGRTGIGFSGGLQWKVGK